MDNNNTMFAEFPDLLTPTEMQKALGIGRNMTYRLLNSGKIRHMRLGLAYRIPKICLVDFVVSSCCHDVVASNPTSQEVK